MAWCGNGWPMQAALELIAKWRLRHEAQGFYQASEACQKIGRMTGVGALTAMVGQPRWVMVEPSTRGGRSRPGSISCLGRIERGQAQAFGDQQAGRYLSAHIAYPWGAVRREGGGQQDRRPETVDQRSRETAYKNIAAVAVANKNARAIWALLRRDEDYRAPVPVEAYNETARFCKKYFPRSCEAFSKRWQTVGPVSSESAQRMGLRGR